MAGSLQVRLRTVFFRLAGFIQLLEMLKLTPLMTSKTEWKHKQEKQFLFSDIGLEITPEVAKVCVAECKIRIIKSN